jgi:FO synthase
MSDSEGYARVDAWSPGAQVALPKVELAYANGSLPGKATPEIDTLLAKAAAGERLTETEIVRLFEARDDEFAAVCRAADELRKRVNGDIVSYAVNRNINYTNICYFRCQFCAFSKGKLSENLRGTPYDLGLDEIVRRAQEAWQRGATEVCMQGGIHPEYTGETYLNICRAIKAAIPGMHIHAFSPLEVWQGAHTLGISVHDFLVQLKEAGLGTLPGTAAEILDDEVRAVLCPDKIKTDEWLYVVEEAHKVGLRTTSTIMYGHLERPVHWARHLLRLKTLQERTNGITEFVPLPFVHMEAPVYWKGRARKGPTFREAVLVHAVARLVLYPHITNIQVSWVKMGQEGIKAVLQAGANDMGGTLMNESITRAAGGEFGQELPPEQMEEIIRSIGRIPLQRTTLYRSAPEEQRKASFGASELQPIVLTPSKRYSRVHARPER